MNQNSPKLETPQKSISLEMNRQAVVYPYREVKRDKLILAAVLAHLNGTMLTKRIQKQNLQYRMIPFIYLRFKKRQTTGMKSRAVAARDWGWRGVNYKEAERNFLA